MKYCLLVLLLSVSSMVYSQNHTAEVKAWQQKLNAEFADKEKSPLTKKDLRKFKGLAFFPIDSTWRIEARFVRTPNEKPFEMPTTTSRLPIYEKYGEAHFTYQGENYVLNIYQNHQLRETEEYKDYLFLPFTDASNGEGSYGGGRYIELSIPQGESILIDFNKAYNPYCVYNTKYSCPIPPAENDLPIPVKAGVKDFKKKK
ncbi:DUF1684 domain-containing protein [Cytophagales bacterium LB-30]|uniref:DUF1684 domain-containing protein n=1 Tax=Shiella aurantiaca TaxID=3058365 RepID=A0ABT8F900_9BACT|nr:DUF1684 domain-containing protein [Shiella aurantiaca]MDN4166676.1 DUF1684 domain-containing protein [Shiella aurantiaca]